MADPTAMEEVLFDRSVGFGDQLQAFIQQELGQPSPDEAMKLALSSCCSENERQKAFQQERVRYRDEVQLPAFRMLRDRRRQATGAVRKEPLAFACELDDEEADYYRDMLDGTDPFLSRLAGGGVAVAVASLSLNIAWPPSRHPRDYPGTASIAGCHESLLLVSLGNCSPFEYEPGFYMVYNTRANSAAVVPRLMPRPCCDVSDWSHCHIARDGGSAAGSTNDDDDGYLLVELLLRRRHRCAPPTRKATLFTWKWNSSLSGAAGEWIPKEVVLPLPGADEDEEPSFRADMAFAVGPTSICWVDLLTGVLLYNHTSTSSTAAAADVISNRDNHSQISTITSSSSFHFIPLPPGISKMEKKELFQEEHRSMCCINNDDDNYTLKLVSMEGHGQEGIPVPEMTLTTWILTQPLSSTEWQWHLSDSVRIRDLWVDPHYSALPMMIPSFPVISKTQPHVVYLKVFNYGYNGKHQVMQATEVYVLGIDMHRRGVVSAFKAPSAENGLIKHLSFFAASDFTTSYLNRQQIRDDLCPRGKEEVADEGGSRSNNDTAAWASVWISRRGENVGPCIAGRVINTPCTAVRASASPTPTSSSSEIVPSCPAVGLQCVLD